jgi:hypothetical protein
VSIASSFGFNDTSLTGENDTINPATVPGCGEYIAVKNNLSLRRGAKSADLCEALRKPASAWG